MRNLRERMCQSSIEIRAKQLLNACHLELLAASRHLPLYLQAKDGTPMLHHDGLLELAARLQETPPKPSLPGNFLPGDKLASSGKSWDTIPLDFVPERKFEGKLLSFGKGRVWLRSVLMGSLPAEPIGRISRPLGTGMDASRNALTLVNRHAVVPPSDGLFSTVIPMRDSLYLVPCSACGHYINVRHFARHYGRYNSICDNQRKYL